MSRCHLLGIAAGALAGVLLSSLGSLHAASAARLTVTAAPIQMWTVSHGLPELPVDPSVDSADSAPPTSSSQDTHGDQTVLGPVDPGPSGDQEHASSQGGEPQQAPTDAQHSEPSGTGATQPPGSDDGSAPGAGDTSGASEVTQDVASP